MVTEITKNVKKIPTKLKPAKVPEQSIFDKVRNDPRFTVARSVDWFKKTIQNNDGNSPTTKYDLLRTTKEKQFTFFLPGSLYIFKYMPKYSETLEYYDMWPCSLIFSVEDGLARGINFHYLPIHMRAKLFDKLWLIASVNRNNQQQAKRITWKFLNNAAKFPEIAPAVKSYLYSHVQSRLIKVDVDDWKTALLLPIESFSKKSQSFVARASGQIIRKNMSR
jgi:hypothetical protein